MLLAQAGQRQRPMTLSSSLPVCVYCSRTLRPGQTRHQDVSNARGSCCALSLPHWPGNHSENDALLLVATASGRWCTCWRRTQGLRHRHDTPSDEVNEALACGPMCAACAGGARYVYWEAACEMLKNYWAGSKCQVCWEAFWNPVLRLQGLVKQAVWSNLRQALTCAGLAWDSQAARTATKQARHAQTVLLQA